MSDIRLPFKNFGDRKSDVGYRKKKDFDDLWCMRTLLILSACLLSFASFAQEKNSIPPEERWVFGGNIALAISTNSTVIGAAPTVGYRVTERLTTGAGFMYFYQSWRSPYGTITNSIYGPQAYARFTAFRDLVSDGDRLFLQSDYYVINTDYYDALAIEPAWKRGWIPQWYVGGGYYTSLGGRLFGGLTVMWDLIQDRRAPFANPLIQGGISVGI